MGAPLIVFHSGLQNGDFTTAAPLSWDPVGGPQLELQGTTTFRGGQALKMTCQEDAGIQQGVNNNPHSLISSADKWGFLAMVRGDSASEVEASVGVDWLDASGNVIASNANGQTVTNAAWSPVLLTWGGRNQATGYRIKITCGDAGTNVLFVDGVLVGPFIPFVHHWAAYARPRTVGASRTRSEDGTPEGRKYFEGRRVTMSTNPEPAATEDFMDTFWRNSGDGRLFDMVPDREESTIFRNVFSDADTDGTGVVAAGNERHVYTIQGDTVEPWNDRV